MKKTLVSALTAALVVGAVSTTFAAANPFSDVPADHWAYDAVTQLAADGVVTGYGDGKFKGDKNITRYEMAQIVAKAMAKPNVSGNDKALVNKLAAEFADELNNLGVRVSNLERNADMVKWNGEARYTYYSPRLQNANGSTPKANDDELLLRLEPSAEVNSNWHVKARLDSSTDLALDATDPNSNHGTKQNTNVVLQRIWAQGDYKNFSVQLGKFPDVTNYDKALMLNDQMSGAAVTFGNKLQATIAAGRIDIAGDTKMGVASVGDDTAANLQSIVLNYSRGKATGTAAYYHASSSNFKTATYSKSAKEDSFGAWEAAGGYRFNKNVMLSGAYIDNTKADSFNKSWMGQLDYKGSNKANVGSWGAYVAYRNIGKYASIDPIVDGVLNNTKGWELGTQYTLFKNVQAKAIYFKGTQLDNGKDASKLFGRVEFFF